MMEEEKTTEIKLYVAGFSSTIIWNFIYYSILIAGFYLNYKYIGENLLLNLFLIFFLIIHCSSYGNKMVKKFKTKKELKEYIINNL